MRLDRGAGNPTRILIDSMVIDHIAETAGLIAKVQRAVSNGAMTIIETHILRDQLSQTRNEARRSLLLRTYDALPKQGVPTAGAVFDVSRFDEAEYGDADLASLATRGRGRMQDALLASTASGKADVLVTNDGDLRDKITSRQLRCAVWSLDEFTRFVEGHS